MRLTVVGSLNLDLLVRVDRLPRAGETVVASAARNAPGGKGANQAAAAAQLSIASESVHMVGRVGDDPAARVLVDDLAQRGVQVTDVLITPGTPTGAATVAVDAAGENLIIVAPGANSELTTRDVEIAAVREADVVLLQLETPLPSVTAAARAATGLVVLNAAPPQALPRELLDRVDVLVPNESELIALAGADAEPGSDEQLAALARSVTSRDVVVTLGARGALVVPASGPHQVVVPPPAEVVDTTGAGDCFCAALGMSLMRGAVLVDAARYATAAATLSTTGRGARGALPGDDDVRAVLR